MPLRREQGFFLVSALGLLLTLAAMRWMGRAPVVAYHRHIAKSHSELPLSVSLAQRGSRPEKKRPGNAHQGVTAAGDLAPGSQSVTGNITRAEARLQLVPTPNGTQRTHADLSWRNDSDHINPHDFRLLIDQPLACLDDASGSPKDVFLLVLITTVHSHFERRRLVRETWGSPRLVDGRGVVTLFLLARTRHENLQRRVINESAEFRDIIQEDFVDSYRNLTYKTVMGLKWAATRCPHAAFVMKTDDDMYVSYANLLRHLAKARRTDYMVGHENRPYPIRQRSSKWYMPLDVYKRSRYPPFLSGTGYVMSSDVAARVYRKSLDIKFIHLEDVFVALCWEALGLTPTNNANFHNYNVPYSYCTFRKLFTSHSVSYADIQHIWNDQKKSRTCFR